MLALVLAAALEFTPQDADLAFNRARELVENCSPRDVGTVGGRRASYRILDAARAAGADVRRDVFRAMTPAGEREFANLYAEFKNGNPSSRWVVVVSHYDTKSGVACPGANDGASTTGLLIGLANAVSGWKTPKGNLMLIWTDGEECMSTYRPGDGLWGSRRAADCLAEKGLPVQAVICVDMLGDRDLSISIPSNGSPELSRIAIRAAGKAGCPGLVHPIAEQMRDDHVPFLEKGFKAIDLIDFNYGPGNSYWHTPQDTMDKISRESLLKSGRVLAELLNILL